MKKDDVRYHFLIGQDGVFTKDEDGVLPESKQKVERPTARSIPVQQL